MSYPKTNSEKRFSLMGAGEYESAAKLANEAIAEAVARYLHDAMLEKGERQEESELM